MNEEEIANVREAVQKCAGENARGSCSLGQTSPGCELPLTTKRSRLALRPNEPSFVREMLPGDYKKRIEFAHLYRDTISSQNLNICWTDEAHFSLRRVNHPLSAATCGLGKIPTYLWKNPCILKDSVFGFIRDHLISFLVEQLSLLIITGK
jgi:hypothetical protein